MPTDQDRQRAIDQFRRDLAQAERLSGATGGLGSAFPVVMSKRDSSFPVPAPFKTPREDDEWRPPSGTAPRFSDVVVDYTQASGNTGGFVSSSPSGAYSAAIAAASTSATGTNVPFPGLFLEGAIDSDNASTPSYGGVTGSVGFTVKIATSTGYLATYWERTVTDSTNAFSDVPVSTTTPMSFLYTGGPVGTYGNFSTYLTVTVSGLDISFSDVEPGEPIPTPPLVIDERYPTTARAVFDASFRWSDNAGYVPGPGDPSGSGP